MREDHRQTLEKNSRIKKNNDRLFEINVDLLRMQKESKLSIELSELEIERLKNDLAISESKVEKLHNLLRMDLFSEMELNQLRSEKNAQEFCQRIEEDMKSLRNTML